MPEFVRLAVAGGIAVSTNEELRSLWDQGKDFIMSTTGQYCSIRDLEYLRAQYDNITILANNKTRTCVLSVCIWDHPLRGLTTYV